METICIARLCWTVMKVKNANTSKLLFVVKDNDKKDVDMKMCISHVIIYLYIWIFRQDNKINYSTFSITSSIGNWKLWILIAYLVYRDFLDLNFYGFSIWVVSLVCFSDALIKWIFRDLDYEMLKWSSPTLITFYNVTETYCFEPY